MKVLAALLPLLFLVGCAKYEYDIVDPPDLTAHVGTKSDVVTEVDPLVYRWRTADNRLVVRVENPTDEPIMLLGERSTAVSPDGESHPLRGQTIAPHSHAKLILPPPRPRVYDSGPTFGVGVGVHSSTHHPHHGYPGHDPYWDGPRYLAVYDDANAIYWDWKGETVVRLTLVYRRGDQTFSHPFTIRRKKM